MNNSTVEKIQDIVREALSKSTAVSFKTTKSLDNIIKKIGKDLSDLSVDSLADETNDDAEKVMVGRIPVTKIGEKSNKPRVVSPGDTAKGDQHSENFYGRPSAIKEMQ